MDNVITNADIDYHARVIADRMYAEIDSYANYIMDKAIVNITDIELKCRIRNAVYDHIEHNVIKQLA